MKKRINNAYLAVVTIMLVIVCGCGGEKLHPKDYNGFYFSSTPTSNTVICMERDSNGYMWLGTDKGINIFDGKNYRAMIHDPEDTTTLPSDRVTFILRDKDGMWAATTAGVARFGKDGLWHRYPTDSKHHSAQFLMRNNAGEIMALYSGDVCVLRDGMFHKVLSIGGLSDDKVWESSMVQASNGSYLINTGIYITLCDSSFKHVRRIGNPDNYTVASDSQYICVASPFSGITYYSHKDLRKVYSSTVIRGIVPQQILFHGGRLLIISRDGVMTYKKGDKSVDRVSKSFSDEINEPFLSRLYEDSYGQLWAGYVRQGFKRINLTKTEEDSVVTEMKDIAKLYGIQFLAGDGQGHVMGACNDDRLFLADSNTRKLKTFRLSDFIDEHSRQHVIYVGFSAGLYWVVAYSHLFAFSVDNGLKLEYFSDFGLSRHTTAIAAKPIASGLAIALDGGNTLILDAISRTQNKAVSYWNGKAMNPLINRYGDIKETISNKPKFFNNGDDRQQIAVKGGIAYSKDNKLVVRNSVTGRERCLWQEGTGNSFLPNTLCLYNNHTLLAVDKKGLNVIPLYSHLNEDNSARLCVEGINIEMPGGKIRRCNVYDAGANSIVSLSHNENDIAIQFAVTDKTLSGNYIYEYRMKGTENGWHTTDGNSMISYPKLSPGDYTFEIRALSRCNPEKILSRSMPIHIARHPLLSNVAILIYVILVIGLVYFANRIFLNVRMARIKATAAESEKQKEIHLNRMNRNFFANISHELRNPLAMISGPISVLKKDNTLSKTSQTMVRLLSQSSAILLKLIDQMLDFNRLDDDALRLAVSRHDATRIIVDLTRHYEVLAKEKAITLNTVGFDTPVIMPIDEDKLSKITDNLLTNAIQHTPIKGRITVEIGHDGKLLTLRVSNTGEPIAEDQLKNIFRPYYESGNAVADWGGGVGLYYVSRLVKLHHGKITVENLSDGVSFTVSLLMDENIYKDSEWEEAQQGSTSETTLSNDEDTLVENEIVRPNRFEETTDSGDNQKKKVLIVEPDLNISFFLRRILEGEYVVYNRYDADGAIDSLPDIMPNIIIAEINFPDSSGIDLCTQIKEDARYENIGVILLSADNASSKQIDSVRAGADACLVKPFNSDILIEIVRNLISRQERITELEKAAPEVKEKKQVSGMTAKDKAFVKDVNQFMEKNLSDGDLNIAKLCRKTLMSRAKLYQKIKELTGCTPNELFRNYKLNKAAKMLKQGKYNVSEVSDLCGFSSIAYFSRTFKKHFGVTPKNYN